jgi:hypothetical protein
MKSNLENSSQNGNSGQNDFAAATAQLSREFVMQRFVMQFRRWLFCNLACATVSLLVSTIAVAQTSPLGRQLLQCDKNTGILCTERPGLDDNECFGAALLASIGLIPIGGCIDADIDFDGVPYRKNTWPGTLGGVTRKVEANTNEPGTRLIAH